MTDTEAAPILRDRLAVTAGALVWIVGTLVGMGRLGGSPRMQQGEGLFSDHATLIAPHGPAFTIWPVIYALLAAYVLWQWLPAASGSRWAGATRLLAAASLVLNGAWLLTVYAGWLFTSLVVMCGLVLVLGLIMSRVATLPAEGLASTVCVAATFGLYLGWICVATCANVASLLVGLGVRAADGLATTLCVVVLGFVVVLAGLLSSRAAPGTYRASLIMAMAWGLAWVAVGRLTGELRSTVAGGVAIVAACGVIALGAWTAARRRRVAPEHRPGRVGN